jgi:curli biogenesis system outer membrane secretion channel CsgG
MNHNITLAIVAIVAATTLTAVAFAIPQQALAYKHHHNNNNQIKVDQQVNQQNDCTGVPVVTPDSMTNGPQSSVSSSTVCVNQGDNSADIVR